MEFEYDENKSKINKEKHGIDFKEAQNLWLDDNGIEIEAKSDDEKRFALIAKYLKKIWSAFFTYRKNSIRIISVRRAREKEKRIYNES